MILNVSGLMKEPGSKTKIDEDSVFNDTEFAGAMYRFEKPVHISGDLTYTGKSFILALNCAATVATVCARCMKDISVDIEFSVNETFIRRADDSADDIDVTFFDNNEIDTDETVMNAFYMNLTGKYLCKPDCKGLCSKCGADLNEGECGCDKEEIDPRWQALIDIAKANENKEQE